jgi:hypothetical protein
MFIDAPHPPHSSGETTPEGFQLLKDKELQCHLIRSSTSL